jgi:protein TonB
VRSILTVAALAVVLSGTALAQQGEVHKVGNGVMSPVLRQEVKPTYTEGAMRRKVQGTVELTAIVLKDGTVGNEVVVTRSLDDELDEQAIKAAKQWLFKPGTKDGQAVNVQVNIELTFTLRDKR